MREETQVRERLERLLRENETLRQQAARHLLGGEWLESKAILDRISHNESTWRALDWALGGKA
jgi:hypothetical protein